MALLCSYFRFNEFDHKFFGITEAEADFMDPQQKLLLQCTYRALEDAGIAMESISGSRTGVYIGDLYRCMTHLKLWAQFRNAQIVTYSTFLMVLQV